MEKMFPEFMWDHVSPMAQPVILKYGGSIGNGVIVRGIQQEEPGKFFRIDVFELTMPDGEILQYDAFGIWLKLNFPSS